MRLPLITVVALLLFSCGTKQEGHRAGHAIKVVQAEPHVISLDSVDPPAVYKVSDARIQPFPMGKPTQVNTGSNVRRAGAPAVVKAGTPRVRIPGQDSCAFPIVVAANASSVSAGQPEVVEAGPMARTDCIPACVASFGKLQGLKHDEIYCMLEDHSGNLWFGTNHGGATKYDGRFFSHYTTNEGLVSNNILCMLEDRNGNIWFGTDKGASKYDGLNFTNYSSRNGLSEDVIMCITEDHLGNIWFGTGGKGATRFDGRSFAHFTTRQGLGGESIFAIHEDRTGKLWFGTMGGGVTCYDGNSFLTFTSKEGLASDNVVSIQEDFNGHIWLATVGGGVTRYDGDTFSTYTTDQGLIDNAVGGIIIDHSGNLWFATQGGACSFDGDNFASYTTEQGLTNNLVYTLLEDRSGKVWLGTGGGGVCRIDGVNFNHLSTREGLINSAIYSILEESNGTRWLGTGDGLIRMDSASINNYAMAEDAAKRLWVPCIHKDAFGKIWMGVDKEGLVWFDGANFNKLVINEELSAPSVYAMLEDQSGALWFGTAGNGIMRYDGAELIQFTVKNGLCDDRVKSLFEDSNGTIWIGTEGGGVSKFNGRQFENFNSKNGLAGNIVYSIKQDTRGNIWLGTDEGLCGYDGKSFAHFTTQEGLSNNAVLSLWADSTSTGSDLWIGTRMGFCRTNTLRMDELLSDSSKKTLFDDEVLFKTYNSTDGFIGNGCNRGAMRRMSDGTLWVGANDLLTIAHTNNLLFDISAPTISLVGLELFNERVNWQMVRSNPDSAIQLSTGVSVQDVKLDSLSRWYGVPQGLSLAYNNNNLTFRFLGITMHQPEKVKYQYKLLGFDNDWNALTSENTAHYSSLVAGTYTFMVRALNSEGIWSNPISYAFTIRPPWWATWWAYGIYIFIVVFSIRLGFRWRYRVLKSRQIELEQKITKATLDIRREKERSEDLLLNILPEQVAEELKERGEAEARLVENVSVLFTDFKGFTEIAAKLSPHELVSKIHEYFSAFDTICARHRVEKIKTIGDAYMAAGGVPTPNETHALDVVAAALEINEFMIKQRDERMARGESYFDIRIGVHTGPVVAGIVGIKKFQYDIWGDTVNTASRMESSCEPGKVNISQTTYDLVKSNYECEYRGEVQAKGKGMMKMYFVGKMIAR